MALKNLQFIKPSERSNLQEYKYPIFIDEKSSSYVFRISNEAVVKVPKNHLEIGREMTIGKMLYYDGFPVPKPLGWDFVDLPSFFDESKKGYIMEFISGQTLTNLYGAQYSEAKKELEAILQKAQKQGYDIGFDALNEGNSIFSENRGITLIDFMDWAHKDVPHITRSFSNGHFQINGYIDPNTVF